MNESSKWKTIAFTGLVAGTLDIIAACFFYFLSSGNGPMNVLLFIASGVFGTDAFSGGISMALAGLAFHYIIAYVFTIILFMAYPKISPVLKNKFVLAIVFGLAIWVIMNLVILPLSSVPKSPFNLVGALKGAAILIVAVGLPISWSAHTYYSK